MGVWMRFELLLPYKSYWGFDERSKATGDGTTLVVGREAIRLCRTNPLRDAILGSALLNQSNTCGLTSRVMLYAAIEIRSPA